MGIKGLAHSQTWCQMASCFPGPGTSWRDACFLVAGQHGGALCANPGLATPLAYTLPAPDQELLGPGRPVHQEWGQMTQTWS